MSLASIQRIISVEKHPQADLLDVVQVLGYRAIVKRDQWKVGELCVFIEPDTVLPDAPWSAFYRAKGNRIKAIRLRQVWSFGVVESISNVGYAGPVEDGLDISEGIGVFKYEAPQPQDLSVSGPYGMGIPKTDETKIQSLLPSDVPYGQLVDIGLKVDGQSFSAFVKINEDGTVERGVGGRSFVFKSDVDNNYTKNERHYGVLDKLEAFCRAEKVNLCLRGESYGVGIQAFEHNPHSKLPVNLAFFSVWLIDERRYARKGEKYYVFNVAPALGLPTVPLLEKDVVLTPEIVHKYDEGIDKIDGKPFEGVVVQHATGSFKIINKHFDSKK